ncbi:hypothetical protein TSUD_345970 [Trifolium subterraneum]|nr:hypothetical protein TSUD_345970 [Trifolium subterraneum]
MSTKSEKNSKRKSEMKPKIPTPRTRFRRSPCQCSYGHIGAYDWLPIPKDKYPEYLADVAAAAKARAEGKPIDPYMFRKYFRGKETVYKPKPLPKWKVKQALQELEEKDDARVKANALKRKKKKAYRLKKEMKQHLEQMKLEQEQLLQKCVSV